MPAAAVIPAPIAYIKVVAVKKLVVGFLLRTTGPPTGCASGSASASSWTPFCTSLCGAASMTFTLRKLECFKQAHALNTLAWNNKIDLDSILLVFGIEITINRDNWGHSYLTVRGEILGFVKDGLLRKHLPRMFSLIKNES